MATGCHTPVLGFQHFTMVTDIRQEWEGNSDDGDLGPAASAETVSDQEEQPDQEERQPVQQQQRRRQRQRQQRVCSGQGEAGVTLGGEQAASGVSLANSAFVAADGAAGAKAISDPTGKSLGGRDGMHVATVHCTLAMTVMLLGLPIMPAARSISVYCRLTNS